MKNELSISEMIWQNGECPLKLEVVPAEVHYCLVFLRPGCAEYNGHCNYRDKKLTEMMQYPLGD
ncbi:MAG: hypothetical protein QXN71_01710 [Candidatus Aenigmatarchaeota archaeon]